MPLDVILKQTPLYQSHLQLKAKIVGFGGWDMPLQYGQGILAEYQETRKGVTVFDTSHMGEFFISGDPVSSGLDNIVTQPLKTMAVQTCLYGMMLNEHGGVIDDLIVYRLSPEQWMLVINASTMENDERHILGHLHPGAEFLNRSWDLGKLDIQGPGSRGVLSSFIKGIERLDYYSFDFFEVLGEKVLVSRTGYTGELGYEIYYPWQKTEELWNHLLDLKVKPAGLGARDVLRMEMGYSLYGHELAEDISPLEAGLNKFIHWDKDFIGKSALLQRREQGIKQILVALVSDTRRCPRVGQTIFSWDKKPVGRVTSGSFSPSLQKGMGLGFVLNDFAAPRTRIWAGDDPHPVLAFVSERPLYHSGTLKK